MPGTYAPYSGRATKKDFICGFPDISTETGNVKLFFKSLDFLYTCARCPELPSYINIIKLNGRMEKGFTELLMLECIWAIKMDRKNFFYF